MSEIETRDQELFDRIGEKYAAKDSYPPASRARRFQVETLMQRVGRQCGKSRFGHILDIGCGVGANALYLEKHYDRYTGIDHSEKLIRIAREIHGRQDASFQNVNIKDFREYRDCDLVLGVGVLHHVTGLRETMEWLGRQCREDAVFAFIEPQRGNPLIQIMRAVRKGIDRGYSEDQVFFSKEEIGGIFLDAGFCIDDLFYFGYFSVPFAQVILKPAWFFSPLSGWSLKADKWIQDRFDSRLAWNMLIIASKQKQPHPSR
jgi:SAM-dependent methyltransferase